MKRKILGLCLLLLLGFMGQAKAGEYKIALVAKFSNFLFFDEVFLGAQLASSELGVSVDYVMPVDADPLSQIDIIKNLIESGVDAIIIDASDADAVLDICQKAIGQGVVVTAFDSPIKPEGRNILVEPIDSRKVAEKLLDITLEYTKGEGQYAILSGTKDMYVQNKIIKFIREIVRESPEKYAGLELVEVVYGDSLDDLEDYYDKANKLLEKYPNIKNIVATVSIGAVATAQAVEDNKKINKVNITGIAFANDIIDKIKKGIVGEIVIWDPVSIGYLNTYATWEILNRKIIPKKHEKFFAGKLGEITVLEAEDKGCAIIQPKIKVINNKNLYN